MKLFIVISTLIVLASCGNTEETEGWATEEMLTVKTYPEGKKVYSETCVVCHQENGQGLPGAFPPLANSDYMMADKQRIIEGIVNGVTGEITVNGEQYNGIMPPQELTAEQTRDVVNYVLNSWGNDGGEVMLSDVEKVKAVAAQ